MYGVTHRGKHQVGPALEPKQRDCVCGKHRSRGHRVMLDLLLNVMATKDAMEMLLTS
jgi:hypothetical protein